MDLLISILSIIISWYFMDLESSNLFTGLILPAIFITSILYLVARLLRLGVGLSASSSGGDPSSDSSLGNGGNGGGNGGGD